MECLLPTVKETSSSQQFYKLLFLLVTLSSLLLSFEASALFEAGSFVSDAKLISSVEGVGDQKTIWIGLDIHLKSGWDTYWRSPGASGYGIKIDWSGSKNLQSTKFYWPAPLKFESFKLIANGYKNEVIFPIQVTLKKQHSPLFLKAKLDYLACDVGNCIPQNKIVTLMVPNSQNIPSTHLKDIASALKKLPEKSNPYLKIKSAQFIQHETTAPSLRLTVFHGLPLISPDIFIEGNQRLFYDKIISANTRYNAEGDISTIYIPIYKNEKRELVHTPNLIGQMITVTLRNGDTTIEEKVPVSAPPISSQNTFIMYGVALLGGFILNFMPCVLPIILLKIFSLTKYGGRTSASVRKALFLSVLGIISSFMILAFVPILLGLLGISFGWGMQFQEPIFLAFMMLILTLFTANFWGFYEIILPEPVLSLGYEYSEKTGNLGHFLTGMFTTLLTTPCSAPYLGTAITFALSQGPVEILLVFFFLGVGLSLPFILVIIFPKIATYLPKPGKWMNVFKHVLGWGFFFTMLWLFYVLTSQVTFFTSIFILSIMLFLLLVFWLRKKFSLYKRFYIVTIIPIALIPVVLLSVEHMSEGKESYQHVNMEKIFHEIKSNVSQGKIVFVDVTADWCLTCKANEFLVLDTQNIKNLIKKNNVDFITIDWTSRDPEVYEFLKSFDRNGIPFYVIYGPHTPYGQLLPQLLTFSSMDTAFKKAQ